MKRQKDLEKLMSKLSVSVEDYRDYVAKQQSILHRLRDTVKKVYSLVKDHQEIPENVFRIDVEFKNVRNGDTKVTIIEYFKDSLGYLNKLITRTLLHFNDVKEIVYTYGTTFSYIREDHISGECFAADYLYQKSKAAKLFPLPFEDKERIENYLKENAPQI
jgi:hypothetical protein